jgi:hypothetical protein
MEVPQTGSVQGKFPKSSDGNRLPAPHFKLVVVTSGRHSPLQTVPRCKSLVCIFVTDPVQLFISVETEQTVKLSLESPKLSGVYRLTANHRFSFPSKAHQKQGPFPPPALPGITGIMALSDSRPDQYTIELLRVATPYPGRVSHVAQDTFPTCCPHYPGGSE